MHLLEMNVEAYLNRQHPFSQHVNMKKPNFHPDGNVTDQLIL